MIEEINKELFKERLTTERKAKKLTQKQLANILGTNYQSYQRYENGKVEMNYNQLYTIAKTLDISIDYLLGLTEI